MKKLHRFIGLCPLASPPNALNSVTVPQKLIRCGKATFYVFRARYWQPCMTNDSLQYSKPTGKSRCCSFTSHWHLLNAQPTCNHSLLHNIKNCIYSLNLLSFPKLSVASKHVTQTMKIMFKESLIFIWTETFRPAPSPLSTRLEYRKTLRFRWQQGKDFLHHVLNDAVYWIMGWNYKPHRKSLLHLE